MTHSVSIAPESAPTQQELTSAQKRALKAAETRKRNAEAKKQAEVEAEKKNPSVVLSGDTPVLTGNGIKFLARRVRGSEEKQYFIEPGRTIHLDVMLNDEDASQLGEKLITTPLCFLPRQIMEVRPIQIADEDGVIKKRYEVVGLRNGRISRNAQGITWINTPRERTAPAARPSAQRVNTRI